MLLVVALAVSLYAACDGSGSVPVYSQEDEAGRAIELVGHCSRQGVGTQLPAGAHKTGNRKQKTENRKQKAETRGQRVENRGMRGGREAGAHKTGSRSQGTESRTHRREHARFSGSQIKVSWVVASTLRTVLVEVYIQ